MSKLFSLKIDVNKIDKTKLFKGEKGTYLSLTCSMNDDADQYGNNVSAWIEQTKEERQSGQDKIYLGNGKVFWSDSGSSNNSNNSPQSNESQDDDLPF